MRLGNLAELNNAKYQLAKMVRPHPTTNFADCGDAALSERVFALISVIDKMDYLGHLRGRFSFGLVIGLVVVALHALSGIFMANDLKLGYKFAVVAAFSPFVLRYWAFSDLERISSFKFSFYDKLSGGSTLSLIFEVALCALVLHPQSRSHQKIWYH